jgi:hypothetical protein
LHRDFRAGYFVQIWSPDEFHGGFVPPLLLVGFALQPYRGGTSFQRTVSWQMKLAIPSLFHLMDQNWQPGDMITPQ